MAVGAALSGKHSFLFANGTHGVVDLAERGLLASLDLRGEVAFDVGIAQGGFSAGVELVGDGGDDVAAARVRVEETATVAEVAGLVVEIDELFRFEIVGANLDDRLGDLLAVGADVLDGSAADIAGDSCETLDSGVSAIDGVEHEVVPVLARAHFEQDAVPFPVLVLRGLDSDAHHEAIKARVAYEQIASPAEDEEREVAFVRQAGRLRRFRPRLWLRRRSAQGRRCA